MFSIYNKCVISESNVTPSSASQTYVQANNYETNVTTSSSVEQPKEKEKVVIKENKSNVDLLSDLDININHAPLVPEVCLADRKSTDEEESSVKVPLTSESENNSNEMSGETAVEEKVENLQIVWDTWYNDVQPKKDPLSEPAILQKFINDIEKYEKFIDSLLVKTLSGATNLDIKWKEVRDFEVKQNFYCPKIDFYVVCKFAKTGKN